MQQIAVRSMDLGDLEAGSQGALGAGDERLHHLGDGGLVQCGRYRVLRREGDGRRPHRNPAALGDRHTAVLTEPGPPGTRLAPGVRQLHASDRTLCLDKTGDTAQRLDVLVGPDAQVFGGYPSV